MKRYLKALLRNITGATAIEYGLIASLVVLAIVGAMAAVGKQTSVMWNKVSSTVAGANKAG